jgi:hypothetical protein
VSQIGAAGKSEALEEGIALFDGAMLTEAVDTGSAGLSLKCVRVRFEAGTPRGQYTVTPVADSEFSFEVDAIVPSIGQDPDLAPLSATLEVDGALLKADQRQATSLERVYAGGDVSSMARFVTEAIGMGKRAAREIDRALRGSADADVDFEAEPVVELAAINTFYYPGQARAVEERLPAAQRFASDSEVQIGFDLEHALAETERCFLQHLHPVRQLRSLLSDLAVKREADGYGLTDYCKGAASASECDRLDEDGRGAITRVTERLRGRSRC